MTQIHTESSYLCRCLPPLLGATLCIGFLLRESIAAAQNSIQCSSFLSASTLRPLPEFCHLNYNYLNSSAIVAICMVGAAYFLSKCCERR